MIGKKYNLTIEPKLIAEIANTHQGDVKYVFKLLNNLKKNNIEYVKFQIYSANELLVENHKRYDHFQRQSFDYKQWDKIIKYASKYFKICFDVFGEESLDYILKKNVYGIKVHSSDLINTAVLLKLRNFKNKIFLSAGGSSLREIDYALSFLEKKNPVLMHGYQNYPTEINETSLNRLKKYQEIYKTRFQYGLQDHLKGGSEESLIVPLMALSYNLAFIEKHVILKREKNRVDSFSSLEPKELKKLKEKISFYVSCIDNKNNFSKKEINYRKIVKKNWVAKKNINVGDIFSLKNIQMKRTNRQDFQPFFFEELEKKICTKKLKNNELITKKNFRSKVVALIIVRLKSKRLKNKALLKIKNKTCLEILISRLSFSKKVDDIIICTTKNREDDKIVNIAKKNKISFFRGSSLNVLSRMVGAIKREDHQLIVRITGDDILIDPEYLDKTIDLSFKTNSDYVTNKDIPSGCEVEIFSRKCLLDLNKYSINPDGTEYLTNYITDHPNEFSSKKLSIPSALKKNYRLTIDTKNDFFIVKKIISNFNNLSFSLKDLINYCNRVRNFFLKHKQIKQKKMPSTLSTQMKWGS